VLTADQLTLAHMLVQLATAIVVALTYYEMRRGRD
jgi:hypothetical protein